MLADSAHSVSICFNIFNEEIRSFMRKVGRKGDGTATFPLQGVYMFDQMGPVGWIDFSNLKLDPSSKAGDVNIYDCTAQAGVPEPKFGGIGPFIPGSYLIPYAEKMQYKVRFYCPSTLQDGEYCFVGDSFLGSPFSDTYEAGPMLWHLTQYDGGRKYVRDTWIVPPWDTPDETYAKTHTQFHSYNLLRLMYPNGTRGELRPLHGETEWTRSRHSPIVGSIPVTVDLKSRSRAIASKICRLRRIDYLSNPMQVRAGILQHFEVDPTNAINVSCCNLYVLGMGQPTDFRIFWCSIGIPIHLDLEILEASEVALSFKTAFLAPEGTLDGLDLLAIVRYSDML